MAWEFDEPDAVGSGDRLNPSDCLGHLLVVWACDYIDHSPTRFTKPGDKSDVIVVDVVDLDLPDDQGYQGALYRRCWWRQARLIGALRNRVGNPNPLLGWMQQGVATMGRPPYELVSATSDKDAVARAQAWANAHPRFEPSFNSLPAAPVSPAVSPRSPAPSLIEQQAGAAAGGNDYLKRLADAGRAGAARVAPPLPPPPPQDDDPPF